MTSTERKTSGVLFILLASLFWSFGGVLSKFAPWSAFTLAGFRSVVSVLILGLYRRSFRVRANAPTWIGAVGVAMTSTLFLMSTKLTSAANAIVLQYAMPVFVILYQALVLKRKPSRVDVGTAAVVLLGVVLCFCQGFRSGGMLGNATGLLSAVSWAAVFLAARMPGCDAMSYTFLGNLLCCAWLVYIPFDPSFSLSPMAWLVALGLGACLGLGYLFFSLGMSRGISSTAAAIVANVEPVLNPTWCFLFLGENPGVLSLSGALVVLLAVTAYSLLSRRRA